MNTAPTLLFETPDNLIQFPQCELPKQKSSYGCHENLPHPADPIKDRTTIKQIGDDLLEAKQYRNYALFICGITFGLRAGDLLSLRIKDITSFTGNTTYSYGKVKPYFEIWEKKTRKYNRVTISEAASQAIEFYLEHRHSFNAEEPLFISRKCNSQGVKEAITVTQLHRFMKSLGKKYNIPGNISSHSLRKTFVYQLISDPRTTSKQLVTIQQMLNHSSFQTTLRYCGIADEDKQELRGYLNDIF